MGRKVYPLRVDLNTYLRICRLLERNGMTMAEWLKRAIKSELERSEISTDAK